MKFIKGFKEEFEVPCVKCRRLGNQETFYIPTLYADNFVSDLFLFPVKFEDEYGKQGIAYFFKRPSDYGYKPYKVYKLKKKYKTVNGEKETYGYNLPLPALYQSFLGISREHNKTFLNVRGGHLPDGTKVILVTEHNETIQVPSSGIWKVICPDCHVEMLQYPGYETIFQCSNCNQLRTTSNGSEIKSIRLQEVK
jgi:ribosomal protein S27E